MWNKEPASEIVAGNPNNKELVSRTQKENEEYQRYRLRNSTR